MDDIERKALGELRFDWAPTKQDVWVDPEVHIDGLNQRALDAVMTAFGEAEASPEVSPLGVAIVGQAARTELAEILEKPVHLFLFVKVRENWGDDPERYREMGLEFPH